MKLPAFFCLALLNTYAFAQTTPAKSISKPDTVTTQREDMKDDWAALTHYAKANATLGDTNVQDRVVFLGSSIFERWTNGDPQYFKDHPNYINRGISGQISPQLLIRFRQDVIGLHPKAVVILAGSNDIAGSTGHVTTENIMDNIRSMVELAQANHIKVILCAYLPVYDYPWRKGLQPADKIIALNKQIIKYAAEKGLILLDYFSPMVDGRNGQKAGLTLDGVHPNQAGYKIMETYTEQAISKL